MMNTIRNFDELYQFLRNCEFCLALILALLVISISVNKFSKYKPTYNGKFLIVVGVVIIAIAIMLRCAPLTPFYGGELSADEYAMARIYIKKMLTGEKWISGGSQAFQGVIIWITYSIFGISAIVARALSTILGLFGLILLYLFIRTYYSALVSVWAIAFFASSSYSILFSRLAIEIIAVLFFTPACLLIGSRYIRAPSVGRGITFGALVALSSFTYPGHLIGLISLGSAIAVLCILRLVTGREIYFELRWFKKSWPSLLASICAGCLVLGVGVSFHHFVMADSRAIFSGGGDLSFDPSTYIYKLHILLYENFYEAVSYYLIYPFSPFLTIITIPLALFATVTCWKSKQHSLVRLMALSSLICWLILPLTGPALGARRMTFVLIPVSLLAGIGLEQVVLMGRRGAANLIGITLATLLALRMGIDYSFSLTNRFETGYCSTLIPDSVLLKQDSQQNIYVSDDEYFYWLDREAMQATIFLGQRFSDRGKRSKLVVLKPDEIIKRLNETPGGEFVVHTMEPTSSVAPILRKSGKCFSIRSIQNGAINPPVFEIRQASERIPDGTVCSLNELQRFSAVGPAPVVPRYEYCAQLKN